jgi:hypothetical protein
VFKRSGIVLLLTLAMVVTACGDDDSGSSDDGGGNGGVVSNEYPQEFVDGYMEGCSADAPAAFCQCSIDAVQDVFTLDEFIGFYSELEAGAPPQQLMDVLEPCVALVGG